jgi:UDP-N-acetyl-D-mannosaminuronic acid transferase (WecB/TagA/CpsF family)
MAVQILGIQFHKGDANEIFRILKEDGGLITVPAAPALVTITDDTDYYEALLKSDIVIPDSGYMVLCWNLLSRNKINKVSGVMIMNTFVESIEEIKNDKLLLINPSDKEGLINQEYLNSKGLKVESNNLYTAPFYNGNIKDYTLLELIETQKPKWILVNIGGGTQEKLGIFLKENLNYKPAIICTGAAIAFKTGSQVKMPGWVDYIYLGWLLRCIHNPKVFIPRYLSGFKLLPMILKYKSLRVD